MSDVPGKNREGCGSLALDNKTALLGAVLLYILIIRSLGQTNTKCQFAPRSQLSTKSDLYFMKRDIIHVLGVGYI